MNESSIVEHLELSQLIVDQGPDAVIFADAQGVIQIWNTAAAELFGYPAEEAVGRSLDIIIPEKLRDAHWKGFSNAVSTGHTTHGRQALKTRAVHKIGQKLYVSLAFAVIKDPMGNSIGAMATAREFIEDP